MVRTGDGADEAEDAKLACRVKRNIFLGILNAIEAGLALVPG
jgi:hypothetical protein